MRDILQRRITVESAHAPSDQLSEKIPQNDTSFSSMTSWIDSPLVKAAKSGGVCILDGIDRLDAHVLTSLRRLIQDNEIDLPSGERLVSQGVYDSMVENHIVNVDASGCSSLQELMQEQQLGRVKVTPIHPDFRYDLALYQYMLVILLCIG